MTKRPRLLLLTDFFPPKTGGIENYLYGLFRNFPHPQDLFVVAQKCPGDLDFDQELPFSVFRRNLLIPFLFPQWLLTFFFVTRLVVQKKIDVLLCSRALFPGLVGILIKRILGKPFFVFTYAQEILIWQEDRKNRKKLRRVMQEAGKIITISNFSKRILLDLGVSEEKIVVVSPAVDFARFYYASENSQRIEAIKEKCGLKNKKVILTVGRLASRKGQDQVIRAMPQILSEVPNAVYLVAGEGEERENLENLVRERNLQEKVIFSGKVKNEDLPYYYAQASVFVMPSRATAKDVEGFGMVFLEAQSGGIPVIAGKKGGAEDAMQDGKTGFLVDAENTQEIADKIILLLKDKQLRKEMGEKGQEFAKHFSWQKQAELFLAQIYFFILNLPR